VGEPKEMIMVGAGLRYEDTLEGTSNFNTWRDIMGFLFEENVLWEFFEGNDVLPVDLAQQLAYFKKDVNMRQIIVDGVKDHIIPHRYGKNTTKDMWKALVNLYQYDNHSRNMLLKEKMRNTNMDKGESIVTYLRKFTQIEDEMTVMGEVMDETDMVRTNLNGFTKK
jgi:hypothetical protein